jgi:hypothetical protein
MLSEYGTDGYHNTKATTRIAIKIALNDLMAETIGEQDVIIYTLLAAAKVNLSTNFRPIATFLDEAGRVPEAKSLTVPAMFPSAVIHIQVGNHMQMGPFYGSYGREVDSNNPYLNLFAP